MRYAILIILFVNIIFAHSQVLTDSLHNMYYYEMYVHIKQHYFYMFCGISDVPIIINDEKIDLQAYMVDFYQKASYCPELSFGLMCLPNEYYKEKCVTRSQLVANTSMKAFNYSKHPAKRIKIKDCILYVDKYLVKGRPIVLDAHHTSSEEPPFLPELLDKYKMDRLVVIDIENVKSLKIDKNELKKIK